jgi:hypothetical protein
MKKYFVLCFLLCITFLAAAKYDLQLWPFTATIQSVRVYSMEGDDIAVVNVTGGSADRFAINLSTDVGKLMYASILKNIGKQAIFWYNADNSAKYAIPVLEVKGDWQSTFGSAKILYQVQFSQ